MNAVIRFFSKVPIGAEGCWEWQAGKYPSGYGQFWQSGRGWGAHRVAWEMLNGQIPSGINVCHHCDNPPCVNPPCVNPAHLFLGTHSDNVADRHAKGRDGGGTRDATHCKRGHERTPENVYLRPDGGRICRLCKQAADRAGHLRRKSVS